MADSPMVCAFCGYQILASLGDFYVAAPGHPGLYVHTISCCGGPFPGMEQMAEPTLRRLDDGTYQRIATS